MSVGDLIAGVGAATKTFVPGNKHPRAATDFYYRYVLFKPSVLLLTTVWNPVNGRIMTVHLGTRFAKGKLQENETGTMLDS